MKFPSTHSFLLTVLTSLVVGGLGGWLGRGYFSDRPAATVSQSSAPEKLSSPSASPTNHSEAQRLRSAHVAQCNLTAKQLLQQVIDKSIPPGKEQLITDRFQAAVTSCDESAVGEMLGTLVANVKPPEDSFLGHDRLLVGCTGYLVRRMLALNPPKALGALLSLIKAGMSELKDYAIEILDVLSESELTQAEELMKPWLGTNSFEIMEFALMQARIKFDMEGVFQDLMHKEVQTAIEGDLEGSTIQNVISRLAQESPEKAMQVLARFPEFADSTFFNILLRKWVTYRPQEVGKWVMQQNQAEIFNTAIGFVETSKIEMDVAWMRDNFSKIKANLPSARRRLASEIAASLAQTDVEGSLRWAASLSSDEQVGANHQIFSKWLKQDPTAASAWLTTWPDGNAKNEAIRSLVGDISYNDPEAALKWAVHVQTNDRFSMMNNALENLATKNPAAAERARQSLPEADRSALEYWKKSEN